MTLSSEELELLKICLRKRVVCNYQEFFYALAHYRQRRRAGGITSQCVSVPWTGTDVGMRFRSVLRCYTTESLSPAACIYYPLKIIRYCPHHKMGFQGGSGGHLSHESRRVVTCALQAFTGRMRDGDSHLAVFVWVRGKTNVVVANRVGSLCGRDFDSPTDPRG